jgi:two-component system sensor histidine kinase/response regulator
VKEKCLSVGMNDFLSKPINAEHLYNAIRRWRKVRRAELSVATPVATVSGSKWPATPFVAADAPILDVAEGEERVGGNKELFVRLLQQFYEKYQKTDEDIDTVLEAGEQEKAQRIAHTIKGVAANLALKPLWVASAEREKSIRENNAADSGVKARFTSALRQAMSAVALHIKQTENPQPPAAAPAVFSPTTEELFKRLKGHLEAREKNAESAAEILSELLEGFGVDAEFKQLHNCIRTADYAQALSVLKKIHETARAPQA